eukprot:GHVL01039370.1.p1 GENE.GHVL01039370.1~~GHVL01039370.1.p1  ORF type:complete len:312 (-),score=70.57 GHVL01039370.1:86-910(-)
MKDRLIWEEVVDKSIYLDIIKSKDSKYIFMSANNRRTSVSFCVPTSVDVTENGTNWPKPKLIQPAIDGVEYYCEHNGSEFFLISNWKGGNFCVSKINDNLEHIQQNLNVPKFELSDIKSDWIWSVTEPLQTPPGMKITDADMFEKGFVLYGTVGASKPAVYFLSINKTVTINKTSYSGFIDIPKTSTFGIGVVTPGVNQDFGASSCRFHFSSPLDSGLACDFDFEEKNLKFCASSTCTIPPERFECEQMLVPCEEGKTRVPITIVRSTYTSDNF